LLGADELAAGELFDADFEGLEVDGGEAVAAGTGGELGFVLAGEAELGGEVFEFELLGNGGAERASVAGC